MKDLHPKYSRVHFTTVWFFVTLGIAPLIAPHGGPQTTGDIPEVIAFRKIPWWHQATGGLLASHSPMI